MGGLQSAFQSHNGAIAAIPCFNNINSLIVFQSHNGAIAAGGLWDTVQRTTEFQSHNGAIAASATPLPITRIRLVSIPQWCDCCFSNKPLDISTYYRFNPTMVRLLHELPKDGTIVFNLFQSHNGAIAAMAGHPRPHPVQPVSIPQWCDCCPKSFFSCERPIMRFQSHNGAIAAVPEARRWRCNRNGFNPTMVRLLLHTQTLNDICENVSIPQWCDCCL